ncbi:FAD-dependent oxidoreductase [Psychrosphaera algicola]|uniref:FAD-dependent oxidoreductase n=1 Tax=Psychrosphaera algicola TaxID=3023714 RepID=A0ABT5FC70_9GAMM|nr:FAD-dependent oxidoreductase [Psychrosphaera sp. G1-22]MDC2888187.1 FAD-dependent oxidoreductase [Psychrosphaera sp. G1-22]
MVDLNSLNLCLFDVVVVGGGMVGATQAIALQNAGLSILLLEQRVPQQDELARPPLRVSAVNLASETLLQSLGIWSAIGEIDKCRFDQLAT